MYAYCITPSRRLRAGARLCVVSRSNIINKKFLYDLLVEVKDDRVKMLKVRNKLTVTSGARGSGIDPPHRQG